jgi:ubiquinone/menaquinone biosynthesis C-methylase UbiE
VTRYLMEHEREADRLEQKTDAELSRRHLELAGVSPGMRVLEAGSGTGAGARVAAAMVGPSGGVVALDASSGRSADGRRRAAEAGLANLDFVAGEVTAPPFREGSFDLVWSRFLFGYLPDPDAALAALVRLVRPGGRVVIGEVDGHGLWHWPVPPRVAEALPRFEAVLGRAFDPFAGRKLYHRFRRAGLAQVRAHILPYHLYADEFPAEQRLNWQLKLENLRPLGTRVMGPEAWEALARDYLAMLEDPDTLTYSVVVFAEGVRPD